MQGSIGKLAKNATHRPMDMPNRLSKSGGLFEKDATEVRSYPVIEPKSFKLPTFVKNFRRQILLAGLVLSSSSVLLLSGCSSAFIGGGTQPFGSVEVTGMQGKVHGGQAPVGGATVQIYEVSATGAGYGAAALPVQQGGSTVTTTTTTDGNGSWSYPPYTCSNGADELYVVATGGNPGISPSTNNSALALAAALGTCNNISNVGYVVINEVTTVATAYSLAGFMTDTTHVATSTGNTVGLTNAFSTFNNLVNLNTGNALTVTPWYTNNPVASTTPDTYRSIVPYDTINTLADALAGCVNTDGTPAACTQLFGITGGATNTLNAALYIAHNPSLGSSANIATLMGLVSPTAPFQPTLLTSMPASNPNDFTLTLNFTSGGLGGVNTYSRAGAAYLAIDGNGNVWIPNGARQSVTELDNFGSPLSPTTTLSGTTAKTSRPVQLGGWGATTSGLLGTPQQVAIDLNGNAWVSDSLNCLAAFNASGSPISSTPYTSVCKAGDGSSGIAVDGNNHIWVSSGQYIASATSTGTPLFQVSSGFSALTGFLGADYLGNVWYIDQGNSHFGALTGTGTAYTSSNQAVLSGPGNYSAFGSALSLWIPEGNAGTLNLDSVTATLAGVNNTPASYLPSSEAAPTGIAVDGNNRFYLANQGGSTNSGCTSTTPANLSVIKNGALVSPNCNGYVGGSAYTALGSPAGVAVDQSGNVWVVNTNNVNPVASGQLGNGSGASNVTEFVGLAAPVNPVFAQNAKNGTYGAKP